MTGPSLVWLRRDLRLDDHPALAAAARQGTAIAVYVHDDTQPWPLGGASRWWLHHSLARFQDMAPLVLRRGDSLDCLLDLARQTKAQAVYWNRDHLPGEPEREQKLAQHLAQHGIDSQAFAPDLLFRPGRVTTKTGGSFQVFTAFWRAARALPQPTPPQPAPQLPALPPGLTSDSLDSLGLMPRIAWYHGMAESWVPGQKGAALRLSWFMDDPIHTYGPDRDIPALDGTSRLSPHLAFGEISPRRIWHSVGQLEAGAGPDTFLKELGWRDFCHQLLSQHPHMAHRPLDPKFDAFPWADDAAALERWQRGLTGYPIVDAGMRQLWQTGWMHNRVRMIVGSFLVKDLLLPWQAGEAWFRDTLVDYDPASNIASWQWIAGCGADAAPYFRVFNPVLQGQKFDPQGHYVRRFVPEVAHLPDRLIHQPWAALPLERPKHYPPPMVDHGQARDRALAAFKTLKAPR